MPPCIHLPLASSTKPSVMSCASASVTACPEAVTRSARYCVSVLVGFFALQTAVTDHDQDAAIGALTTRYSQAKRTRAALEDAEGRMTVSRSGQLACDKQNKLTLPLVEAEGG